MNVKEMNSKRAAKAVEQQINADSVGCCCAACIVARAYLADADEIETLKKEALAADRDRRGEMQSQRNQYDLCFAARKVAEANVIALREAFRNHVVCRWKREEEAEPYICECLHCDAQWKPNEPEAHKPDCPAALMPGETPNAP